MADELYEDVKAFDKVSKALSVPKSNRAQSKVKAAERGLRRHPNGVTEEYERLEME